MDAERYSIYEEARGRRLHARRYLRELDAELPFHTSFLSKRRRTTDRHHLQLMQLVRILAVAEEPACERMAA
jgi:hypothetical protein